MKKHRQYLWVRLRAGPAHLDTVQSAAETLATAWDGVDPAERLQVRRSRDGRQGIVEITCLDDVVQAGLADSLAARLDPRDEPDVIVFAEGRSLADSRAACSAYLLAHAADWDEAS